MQGHSLVLVRHGPSAHVHSSGAVDRAGVEQWRGRYDAAGLQEHAQPPASLVHLAARADCFITSDLPRARESAARLAVTRPLLATPLLREYPLAVPGWPTRLPLPAWGTLMYLHWRIRHWQGVALAPADRARVADAARFVSASLGAAALGVVVTHGVLRVLLVEQMRKEGWVVGERRGGYGHWSAWTLRRASSAATASPKAHA